MNIPCTTWRLPGHVIIGRGATGKLAEALAARGIRRPMIVSDPGVAKVGLVDRVIEAMGPAVAAKAVRFTEVIPEPPVACLEAAHALATSAGECDAVIGMGGGSALDVAKALALVIEHGLPIQRFVGVDVIASRNVPLIAIPTTAGTGSEVTPVAILTDTQAQLKVGLVSPHILPDLAIVDAALTDGLPPHVTAATGLDALTHAIEATISRKGNPLSEALALQAAALIGRSLLRAYRDGSDKEARNDMATGATLAGVAFAHSSCCAVHALAYPLGGRHHVPHGQANAMLLTATMRFNQPACEDHFVKLAEAMDIQPATPAGFLDHLDQLCRALDIPPSIRSVGVTEDQIPDMARDAAAIDRLMQPNPRKVTVEDAQAIYRAVY